MSAKISDSRIGILVDWGEPTLIFQGVEGEAYREIMKHQPESQVAIYDSLYATPYCVQCLKIDDQWFAFRDFEHAEITINNDFMHDVGEWKSLTDNN